MKTYTAYSLSLEGKLSHKEHLNNIDEVNEWLEWGIQRFSKAVIYCDQTQTSYILISNGRVWDKIINTKFKQPNQNGEAK